jgi:hypothetical protein
MIKPVIGQKLKVRYVDTYKYLLHVEVIEIDRSGGFIGRVDHVFADGIGEITGGDVLKLRGQRMAFKSSDTVQ